MKKFKSLIAFLLIGVLSVFGSGSNTVYGQGPIVSNPSATSTSVTDPWVSSLTIHMPEYKRKLYKRFLGQNDTLFSTLDLMGYSSGYDGVAQTNFGHWEEGYEVETITSLNSVADPGAGNTISILVDPATVDAQSGTIYAQVKDDVLFPTGVGTVKGKITAITGTTPNFTVVITPHDTTITLGAVPAGQQLYIYSNGMLEADSSRQSRISKPTLFNFGAKILWESFSFSGTESTNQIWFDVNGKQCYVYKGQGEMEARLMSDIDGAAFWDAPINNAALVGNRNMTGLWNFNATAGNTRQYNQGLWGIPDYYAITKQLTKTFGGDQYLGFFALDLYNENEQAFGDLFTGNPLIFSNFDGTFRNTEAKKLDLGFGSVTVSNKTFMLKCLKEMSHPKKAGAPGYNLEGIGMIMPNDRAKDAKTGGLMPHVQFRAKQLDGVNRKIVMSKRDFGITGTDQTKFDVLSEQGIEIFGINRFMAVSRN